MRELITQTVEASEARQHFSELLNDVVRKEKRVLVEKSGVPVAAIISAEDLDRLTELERQRAARFHVLDGIHAKNREVDPDEVERVVAEEIAALRTEQRDKQRPPHTE